MVEVSGSQLTRSTSCSCRTGAEAYVTLEALGTQILRGTVSSIANSGTAQQGIVTYPVTIRVESTEEFQLPEGLSATAQVIIREQTDALLGPTPGPLWLGAGPDGEGRSRRQRRRSACDPWHQ